VKTLPSSLLSTILLLPLVASACAPAPEPVIIEVTVVATSVPTLVPPATVTLAPTPTRGPTLDRREYRVSPEDLVLKTADLAQDPDLKKSNYYIPDIRDPDSACAMELEGYGGGFWFTPEMFVICMTRDRVNQLRAQSIPVYFPFFQGVMSAPQQEFSPAWDGYQSRFIRGSVRANAPQQIVIYSSTNPSEFGFCQFVPRKLEHLWTQAPLDEEFGSRSQACTRTLLNAGDDKFTYTQYTLEVVDRNVYTVIITTAIVGANPQVELLPVFAAKLATIVHEKLQKLAR